MTKKYFSQPSIYLFLLFFISSFSLLAQKDSSNYRRILKVNFMNNTSNYFNYLSVPLYDNFEIGLRETYDARYLNIMPSIQLITKRKNIVEYGVEGKWNKTNFIPTSTTTITIDETNLNSPIYKKVSTVNNPVTKDYRLAFINSYHYNFTKKSKKLLLSLGIFNRLAYNYQKNVYDFGGMLNANIISDDIGLIPKIGVTIHKKIYLEASYYIRLLGITYGSRKLESFPFNLIETPKTPKIINYYKEGFDDVLNVQRGLSFSLGYKF